MSRKMMGKGLGSCLIWGEVGGGVFFGVGLFVGVFSGVVVWEGLKLPLVIERFI